MSIANIRERVFSIWKQTILLAWPIVVQKSLGTLMRTVDIFVTGLFSPAAVAALGLADLYAKIPRRVGSSLGTGAIAISSQDTGSGEEASRDRAITQSLIIGFIMGLPFVGFGLLFAQTGIAVLGATSNVVVLGGTYLMIIFMIAPFRIIGVIGAKSLQGTGDTRTPMYINGGSNFLNIIGTVGLGLGVAGLPRLGIVGVALATALSRMVEAVVLLGAIYSSWTGPSFAKPKSVVVTRQLISMSVPRFAEQMSRGIVTFPFNALLLLFGTEVNAAYHIGTRIYQQIAAPLYRTSSTVTSIIVGQDLGRGDPEEARFAGYAIVNLSFILLTVVSLGLYLSAEPLVGLFTNDWLTVGYATTFVRVFAIALLFRAIYPVFAGGLRGAGDTRTPFYAQFTGQFGFLLGFSYITSIILNYGLLGIYLGIILSRVWSAVFVANGFILGGWASKAAAMMSERHTIVE